MECGHCTRDCGIDEQELIEAGLYDPDAADAGQRKAALELLGRNGVTVEQLLASENWGALLNLVSDVGRGWEPATLSVADVATQLSLPVERVRRICLSAGITVGDDNEPLVAPSDVAIFEAFELAAATFGYEPMLSFNRVLGAALASVAEAAHRLFDTEVATKVDSDGGGDAGLVMALAAAVASEQHIPDALARTARYHLAASQHRRRAAHGFARDTLATTVGFVDLVASTELAESVSAARWARMLAEFEDVAWDAVVRRGGRVVKLIGDEVMYVSQDPGAGVEMAMAMCAWVGNDSRFRGARGGLAWGEVFARSGDYFGPVVNLAARAVSAAQPGQILVTQSVADRLTPGTDRRAEPLRPRRLKGIEEPVTLHLITSSNQR